MHSILSSNPKVRFVCVHKLADFYCRIPHLIQFYFPPMNCLHVDHLMQTVIYAKHADNNNRKKKLLKKRLSVSINSYFTLSLCCYCSQSDAVANKWNGYLLHQQLTIEHWLTLCACGHKLNDFVCGFMENKWSVSERELSALTHTYKHQRAKKKKNVSLTVCINNVLLCCGARQKQSQRMVTINHNCFVKTFLCLSFTHSHSRMRIKYI